MVKQRPCGILWKRPYPYDWVWCTVNATSEAGTGCRFITHLLHAAIDQVHCHLTHDLTPMDRRIRIRLSWTIHAAFAASNIVKSVPMCETRCVTVSHLSHTLPSHMNRSYPSPCYLIVNSITLDPIKDWMHHKSSKSLYSVQMVLPRFSSKIAIMRSSRRHIQSHH